MSHAVAGRGRRVMVVGLDCLAPALALSRYRSVMPNLRRVAAGACGTLESVCPPITCPAWMCAFTGRDPGQLGVYGFRNRAAWDYAPLSLAFSDSIPASAAPAVWDVASEAGRHVISIGVPPGYPPRRVNGEWVGCFMTPGPESPFSHPADLRAEVAATVGSYRFDVDDARTEDHDRILREVYDMTAKRFRLAAHLLGSREWDLFCMVEIGTDRMHHAFWHFMDPRHVLHVPGSVYASAIRDYYAEVDARLGDLLLHIDDDTLVMVVSDHGAQRMDGGFLINEWLLREGLLRLRPGEPARPGRFAESAVDWSRTAAWGAGGYYGRIFLNVRGREPEGTVAPDRVPWLLRRISASLRAMRPPWGRASARHRIFRPDAVYREVRGFAPDLIVYPGDLYWRALGGFAARAGEVWTRENDTGPDGANHARLGVFAATTGAALRRDAGPGRRLEGLHLPDVAPTVLRHLGLSVPRGVVGKAVAGLPK